MTTTIELVRGLPQKELLEQIHFHHRRGEISERALGFYLLDMEERRAFLPEKDAAAWAWKHLGFRRADKLILLSKRLRELPEIDAAFSRGEVPWTKVREIARVATSETEREWLDLARRGTSRELEDRVAQAKRGDRPGEGFKARRQKYIEKICLSGEEKAIWDQAVRKIRSEIAKGATPSEAAVAMARRALLSDPGRKAHARGAFLVVYHRGKDGASWVETAEGRHEVDPSTIEKMVRSGVRSIEVQDIEGAGVCSAIRFGERGEVAPEDRAPPVTPEEREAVLARDGRCLACGCTEDLTVHHLDSHADGGKSAVERLATLCAGCQGSVHDGDVVLRVEEDGSLAPLDREGNVIGKGRSAAEILGDPPAACSLETIAVRAAESAADLAPARSFLSLAERPSEPSAAEWTALQGQIEWSPSQRAFLFHPDWADAAAELPQPPEERTPAPKGLRPEGLDDFVGQREVVDDLLLSGRAARERGETLGHVLLSGQAGLGKTSLSRLLARDLARGSRRSWRGTSAIPKCSSRSLQASGRGSFSSSTRSTASRRPARGRSTGRLRTAWWGWRSGRRAGEALYERPHERCGSGSSPSPWFRPRRARERSRSPSARASGT